MPHNKWLDEFKLTLTFINIIVLPSSFWFTLNIYLPIVSTTPSPVGISSVSVVSPPWVSLCVGLGVSLCHGAGRAEANEEQDQQLKSYKGMLINNLQSIGIGKVVDSSV